ncbi:MAG TPA: hypothetical protein VI643_03165 [Planctomycetota bacterium]|nr:hypothetical protein [Planctomycetota bacterium]
MSPESLERRKKIFQVVSTVGLVVFAIYLVFMIAALHSCDHVTFPAR